MSHLSRCHNQGALCKNTFDTNIQTVPRTPACFSASYLRNKNENCALLSSNLPSVINRSHLSPSRDRLMTRGKLLDNDTQLFIFISILIMTQLHPRDPENRQQNRFSERRFSGKKNSYNRLNGKAWLGLLPVRIYREIMPSLCPLT